MSRMVREDLASGLRERLWFAQTLAGQLREKVAANAGRGEALALRGAVFFHLYSALVGLARHSAKVRNIAGVDDLLSLPAIARAFEAAGADSAASAEVGLLEQARRDPSHSVHWLEQQVMAANGSGGLARRPLPREDDSLGFTLEDPYEPLASGDLDRIDQAVVAVRELLAEAATYLEEW